MQNATDALLFLHFAYIFICNIHIYNICIYNWQQQQQCSKTFSTQDISLCVCICERLHGKSDSVCHVKIVFIVKHLLVLFRIGMDICVVVSRKDRHIYGKCFISWLVNITYGYFCYWLAFCFVCVWEKHIYLLLSPYVGRS